MFSAAAVFTAGLTVVFYTAVSTALQWRWYRRAVLSGDLSWKAQPRQRRFLASTSSWWLPLAGAMGFGRKEGRHQLHAIFSTVNILQAALFMGVATELTLHGYSRILWDWADLGDHAVLVWIASTLAAMAWENVTEYYYHRLMHTRFFYRFSHKYHHFYKSPEPFDDMMVHPLETFGFYSMSLFTPPFVIPMHWSSVLVYATVMGFTGMLDHCGIRMSVPYVYDTVDHDLHHELTNYNYGFPFVFLDILHGTYRSPELAKPGSSMEKEESTKEQTKKDKVGHSLQ